MDRKRKNSKEKVRKCCKIARKERKRSECIVRVKCDNKEGGKNGEGGGGGGEF